MSMRLPAEWEPQQTVLLTFPRRDGDWGTGLEGVCRALVRAANLINRRTPTLLLVTDTELFADYADAYAGETLTVPTDDCWVRDYGPLTTVYEDRVLVLNDFVFNGWGGKYDAQNDDDVVERLWRAAYPAAGYRRAPFVLEGGAIDTDGAGTLLTTTACLLGPGRNGWTERSAAEAALTEYFDLVRVLWLEHGQLAGDDTDGHVDTLARFLTADTIAYVRCDDPADEHYAALGRMEEELKTFRQTDGSPYRLLPLPWPPAVHDADGRRLPLTYANFLISGGAVFVPTYFDGAAADHPGRRADAAAESALAGYGYDVVTVPSRPFVAQNGSLHCLTMQLPAL